MLQASASRLEAVEEVDLKRASSVVGDRDVKSAGRNVTAFIRWSQDDGEQQQTEDGCLVAVAVAW